LTKPSKKKIECKTYSICAKNNLLDIALEHCREMKGKYCIESFRYLAENCKERHHALAILNFSYRNNIKIGKETTRFLRSILYTNIKYKADGFTPY